MALDTDITKESILEHVGLLELRLTNHGTKTITKDERISTATNQKPPLYLENITHAYTIQGEEYQGTLKDLINIGTSLFYPDEKYQRVFRQIIIEHDDKRVFFAERTMGGYDKKPGFSKPEIIPIEPEPWHYNEKAFDTLMHLERALSEFQKQMGYQP